MEKRLIEGSILLCTLLFLFYVYNSMILSQIIGGEQIKTLPTETLVYSESKSNNVKWIAEHDFTESVKGWLGEGILFNYNASGKDQKNNATYVYNPQTGKKAIIAAHGIYEDIESVFTIDNSKVIFHYLYDDNAVKLIDFIETKHRDKDYKYDVIDKNDKTQRIIEIYDSKSGRSERIIEYKSKSKVLEDFDSYRNDFQVAGWSNNGNFMAYCFEEEIGRFVFSIYDVKSGNNNKYEIYGSRSPFDDINGLTISNNGDFIYVLTGKIENEIIKSNIYRYNINDNQTSPTLIATSVRSYKISHDDRYIIYDTYDNDDVNVKTKLMCLNLSNGKEYVISDSIIKYGYSLSSGDNRLAYIEKEGNDGKLIICNLDNSSESKLIYIFQEAAGVDCMDFSGDNKSLLFSYFQNNQTKKLHLYKTCIVELSDL